MKIKQRNLIVIITSLATTAVVFLLIIRPTIAHIITTKNEINSQREELEKKYHRIKYLRKNADKLKEIEKQLTILDELFLLEGKEIDFITTLEKLADKNNTWQKINLKEINTSDPKQTTLPFSINSVGKTHDILSHLLAIERLEYYINFDSINIVSQKSSKSSTLNEKELNVQINGAIKILKDITINLDVLYF